MPFLVSFHNLQKREFSKESKGKLFFCLISSTDFFSVSGSSQANLPASKPPCPEKSLRGFFPGSEIRNQISVMLSRHPWLDIGLQERR